MRRSNVCSAIALLAMTGTAAADGERTPMIGFAALGGQVTSRAPGVGTAGMFGFQLESAWWLGRIGFAAEGSVRGVAHGDTDYGGVIGASVRLRLLDGLTPSLLEPRDVEVGFELQGIIERAWWQGPLAVDDGTSYGGGVALRVRGSGGPFTTLLAESRLFVRVLSAPGGPPLSSVARTTTPSPVNNGGRGLTVLVGIGASWGVGDPSYSRRFDLQRYVPPAL